LKIIRHYIFLRGCSVANRSLKKISLSGEKAQWHFKRNNKRLGLKIFRAKPSTKYATLTPTGKAYLSQRRVAVSKTSAYRLPGAFVQTKRKLYTLRSLYMRSLYIRITKGG
jgi:hypothetical protein